MKRLRNDDRGSVLMLVIGLIPIVFAMVAVGVDTAVLFTHRRSLAADADAAALAAAQSADLDRLYTDTSLTELPLNCAAARQQAERQLQTNARDRTQGSRLTKFECNATTVSLALQKPTTLPFAQHFGINPTVEVAASSGATSPFR